VNQRVDVFLFVVDGNNDGKLHKSGMEVGQLGKTLVAFFNVLV
jgi:hypothetical protein